MEKDKEGNMTGRGTHTREDAEKELQKEGTTTDNHTIGTDNIDVLEEGALKTLIILENQGTKDKGKNNMKEEILEGGEILGSVGTIGIEETLEIAIVILALIAMTIGGKIAMMNKNRDI